MRWGGIRLTGIFMDEMVAVESLKRLGSEFVQKRCLLARPKDSM